MAKKKNTIPSGFDGILGSIYSNTGTQDGEEGVTIIGDEDMLNEPPLDDKTKDEEPPVKNTEDGEDKDDTKPKLAKEDDSEIPEEVLNNNNQTTTLTEEVNEEDNTEPSNEDLIEAQQVGLLFDAIGHSLGWNMDDIDEKDRPLTVDDLTQYFAETVRQNSIPEYADERILKLDEYVRNGGKFEDLYAKQQQALTLDNIDMEDEANQKAVIRELLTRGNYTEEQINNKIRRYEDADMLFEESEDALDRLKLIRTWEVEETARLQEQYAREQEEQSKAFFSTVTNDINNLTDIRGIAIPKEDRKALFDYIFKVDQNGVSQYQKDFNENLSKNLIESAYFTMKADALISNAERKGESSANEKLRKLLRHQSKNHTTYNVEDKQKSATDLLAGLF